MYANPKIQPIWFIYVVPSEIGNPSFHFSWCTHHTFFPQKYNHKQQMANHIIKMCLESTILHTFSVSIACFIHPYKIGGHICPYIYSSSSGGSCANRARCSKPLFEHLEHYGAPQTHPSRGIIPTFTYPISPPPSSYVGGEYLKLGGMMTLQCHLLTWLT